MKKIVLLILVTIIVAVTTTYAQNYNNILNYNLDATPVNGVKIKTNMPYTSGTQMPTISILGYNYISGETINLTLVYYIYGGNFIRYQVTSSGTHNPPVSLSQENGKVVIYLDDRQYFQRFTVSAYAQGMSEQSAWFQGWAAADEVLSGTNTVLVPYATKLAGTVTMPGSGIWNSTGNVGIGTTHPDQKLTVSGIIHSSEVIVDTNMPPPDYVFDKTYDLPTLTSVKTYIDKNHHLPQIPSAAEIVKNGQSVGEMNMLLLKKVEELTLYLIEKDKQLQQQQEINKAFKQQLEYLTEKLKAVSPSDVNNK